MEKIKKKVEFIKNIFNVLKVTMINDKWNFLECKWKGYLEIYVSWFYVREKKNKCVEQEVFT